MLSKRASDLRFSNQEIQRLRTIVRHHMRPHSLFQTGSPPTRRAIFRFFRDTQESGVDICLLVMADLLATYGPELPQETWVDYLDLLRTLLENWWEKPEQSISPPKLINGRDLMDQFSLAPGPLIGELLRMVQEAQATGEIDDRSSAISFIEAQIKKRGDG